MHSVSEELGLIAMLPSREDVERVVDRNQRDQQSEAEEQREQDGDEAMQEEMTEEKEEEILKKLHTLLLETSVQEGKLCCGNCGFEYPVKEGVGNFLLPAHLV